jgi:hypothetical protein
MHFIQISHLYCLVMSDKTEESREGSPAPSSEGSGRDPSPTNDRELESDDNFVQPAREASPKQITVYMYTCRGYGDLIVSGMAKLFQDRALPSPVNPIWRMFWMWWDIWFNKMRLFMISNLNSCWILMQIFKSLAPEFGRPRRLFTPNGSIIRSAEEITAGGAVVACGAEGFRRLSYGTSPNEISTDLRQESAPPTFNPAPPNSMRRRSSTMSFNPEDRRTSVFGAGDARNAARSRLLDGHQYQIPVLI